MTLIKQQPFNLDGRKELGKLEMSKEVVVTLIGMGTLALFAFGFFFSLGYIHYLRGKLALTLTSRAGQFLS